MMLTTMAAFADSATTATDVETSSPVTTASVTSAVVQDGASTTPTVASSELITPLDNVFPLNMSESWKERLKTVGVSPDTFWAVEESTATEEEQALLDASRHYFMGWYYVELGQSGRAIEQFSDALKLEPDNSHILLDAARARLAVREVGEARDLVESVLDKESTNVEALKVLAETYLAASDTAQGDEKETSLKRAVDALIKAKTLQPKNLDILRSLARTYGLQQDVEKVISAYRDIVAVDPKDTYSLLVLAQILSRMDRSDEAIEYFQRVIEQRRGFIGGYVYLAQLYERLKRYGDALNLYKQAILVDPRNVDVLKRFEGLLQQIHGASNTSKIIEEYSKFVQEYPVNSEVRRIYAERLDGDGKTDEAIAQYKQILKIDPENSDSLVALGKIYSLRKDFEKAAESLNKAVEINPDRIDLYDAIASTYLARKQPKEAISLYQKAISLNQNDEKLYINLAALLEDDKQTSEAISVMENAVEKVGEKPELLAVLGKFYRSEKDIAKAESVLRKAYDLESSNLPLYGELLSLYLQEGKTTAADEITSRTSQGSSSTKDTVLSVAAEFYFNAGRQARAVELYRLALDANNSKFDYLARLVGILNRQKLFDDSLEVINQYGPKMKDSEKVDQLKAEVFLASKRYDEGIAIYRNLLRNNPLDLNYYQYLVDAYNDAERFDDSVKLVEEAREKFSKSDPEAVLMMAGMVYYKQKKYSQAEKAFLDLIKKTNGQNDDAYYFLGSVYLDQKNFDKAEKQFRKAIDVNPNSANALNALGFMYADRGVKLQEAKELITKALELNPSAPHILDSMGWILYKTGDYNGAEDYVQRAARHFEDAEIYDHLGEIYVAKGKKELAREMFERVLELDPKREKVRKMLESLKADAPE